MCMHVSTHEVYISSTEKVLLRFQKKGILGREIAWGGECGVGRKERRMSQKRSEKKGVNLCNWPASGLQSGEESKCPSMWLEELGARIGGASTF